MWHIEGTRHFRACITFIKLNSLGSTYFLEWDSKDGKAIPIKSSSRQYRAFQSFTLISTLITQPIFFIRCYQIAKSPPGSVTLISYYVNIIGTIVTLAVLPLLWFFSKKSNLQKFVTCFHAVRNLDKRFYGCCYSPAIVTWITDNAPLYGFALHVLNVTSLNFIFRVKPVGSGIVVLNVWTKILLKTDYPFDKTIQIYNQLKVMTILMQEIGHDLVSACLHHAYTVIISTNAMYHFVLQFTPGKKMSIMVTYSALVILFTSTGIEMLAICIVAKASSMSREILRNLLRNKP
ncbi:hypothetical protein Fcan01_16991 [Folsomia candida]|uniref:Uncharacterized protein n=1 Tax=Folsomia candida TaxID=158441 RepID=A0A226DSN9_FOLCA|nr:hypothetical protein Fcan01_16991 [Folsomia candida]